MSEAVRSLVEGIALHGFAVVTEALSGQLVDALRDKARALDAQGLLAPARVGRDRGDGVRGDRIHWLDDVFDDAAESALRALLEELRVACNRALLLGLVDFEGHYALYPPGTQYPRHRDRFREDDRRVLSLVLYLNEAWAPRDGGALRLFVDEANAIEVAPEGGTVVVFLAGDFDHEVLPARKPRWSLAGWFRRRAASAC
jgi:SM-20-related protein